MAFSDYWDWQTGFGKSFLEGEEGGIEKTSTLSKEQQELMEALGPYLQSMVGQGMEGWGGRFAAPLGEYEQMGLGRLGEYVQGGLPETARFGLGQYKQALKGMDPKETQEWYMKHIAPQEARYHKETTLPTIKESMVPGGTLRSTGTEQALGKATTEFGEGQLGRIGGAIMSERAGAREMLGLLPAMYEMEAGDPLRRAEAGLTLGSLPRLIAQQELTGRIADFYRSAPEMSPLLERMMQLLQTQTQAAFYREPQKSQLMELLQMGAQAAGAYAGMGG